MKRYKGEVERERRGFCIVNLWIWETTLKEAAVFPFSPKQE